MKRVLKWSLVAIAGIIIATLLMCYTTLEAAKIMTFADVAFMALTIILIIMTIRSSEKANNLNLYTGFLSRVKELNDEINEYHLFWGYDGDNFYKNFLDVDCNPTYKTANLYVLNILVSIGNKVKATCDDCCEIDLKEDKLVSIGYVIDTLRKVEYGFSQYCDFFKTIPELCEEIVKSDLTDSQKKVLLKRIRSLSNSFSDLIHKFLSLESGEGADYTLKIPKKLKLVERKSKHYVEELSPIFDYEQFKKAHNKLFKIYIKFIPMLEII